MAVNYIIAAEDRRFPGKSSDTWETLADRASQLTGQTVTAADLIAENVGRRDPSVEMINAWLESVGGISTTSAGGIPTYIFPAGLKVRLPYPLTIPDDAAEPAGAVATASSTPAPVPVAARSGGGGWSLAFFLAAGAVLVAYLASRKGEAKQVKWAAQTAAFAGVRRPRRRRRARR